MQQEIGNLEFVHCVHFEYIDSLKIDSAKYMSVFDDSCEEICNSEVTVDFVTAGRHRGLSAFYIQHNLFHPSKLGR